MALALFSVGQIEEAAITLRSYIAGSRGKRVMEAKDVLALVDYISGKGDLRTSASIVQARLKQDPNDLPALMASGLMARSNGKYSEAASVFERIAAIDKQFPAAHRQLAILYAGPLVNVQKAYDSGSKARPAFPNDPELTAAMGKTAYRRNDYQSAARLLAEALRTSPPDTEAHYFLGMVYFKTGRFPEAKIELKKAVSGQLEASLTAEATKALSQIK